MLTNHAVRLPESFRGGCSFGVGDWPISPDVTIFAGRRKSRLRQGCQRGCSIINGSAAAALGLMRQAPDLLHTFWTPREPPSTSWARNHMPAASRALYGAIGTDMSGVNEIRSTFLKFFADNGHEIVPSSPLV